MQRGRESYQEFIRKKIVLLFVLFVLVLILIMVSLAMGTTKLSIREVLLTLIGKGTKRGQTIVYDIRFPRVLAGVLVGGILAVAGAVMQSIMRNPLASASTLGVSQGASFGATIGIIVFGAGVQNSAAAAQAVTINSPYIVTICAFIGGGISAIVILLLSRIKQAGPQVLILGGVALSSLFSGGTTLVQYFAEDVQVAAVVFWTFGDLGRTSKKELLLLFIVFLIAFAFFLYHRWDYNALNSGHQGAKSLGVNVEALILSSMVIATLASAMAVAFVGIISFVGLVAPHCMRHFVGNDYRFLIPASAFSGAILLLLADLFARLVVSPVILPIGAITSFLGAPMFLYLIFKGGLRHDTNQ